MSKRSRRDLEQELEDLYQDRVISFTTKPGGHSVFGPIERLAVEYTLDGDTIVIAIVNGIRYEIAYDWFMEQDKEI